MGALVGKGKSALGTKPLHVAGENETLVQDDLITLQSQCARNAKFRNLVLSVGVGSTPQMLPSGERRANDTRRPR